MAEGQSFPERLRSLRQGRDDALAPLWIEQLPAEEALAELRGRRGPLVRLQEIQFLLQQQRQSEALALAGSLGELPRGLASLCTELTGRIARLAESATVPLVLTPAAAALADPSPPAPREATARDAFLSLESALVDWLSAVRNWRRVLRV